MGCLEESINKNMVDYADKKLLTVVSKIIVAEDQLANICVLKN